MTNNKDRTFWQYILFQSNRNITTTPKTTSRTTKGKQTHISRVSLSILFRPSIGVLAKSKYYKKIQFSNLKIWSFTYAIKSNIENILKIKNVLPSLSSSNIIKIHNIVNNNRKKNKPKFNITTKEI